MSFPTPEPSAGAEKFLTKTGDGYSIESVVISMPTHQTLCVSSQLGCRLGCTFCHTGRMGLIRNLTAAEITGQYVTARDTLRRDIKNVVLMGMGEPLDNFDPVVEAIRTLTNPRTFNLPQKNITLSTAGHVAGLARLAQANLPHLRLAISLHSARDATRNRLMPLNRRYPLAVLRQALQDYPLKKRGLFLIEYVLFAGVNDSREEAEALADFLAPLKCRVNLIPLNPMEGSDLQASTGEAVKNFRAWLVARGVFVRQRTTRGLAIGGACGQLGGGAVTAP